MLARPPSYIGQIEIVGGVNDRIDFTYDIGGGGVAVFALLTPAWYWPTALLTQLGTVMSAAAPVGVVFTAAMGATTGVIAIIGAGGGLISWFPMITVAQGRKALTGGDAPVSTSGANHLGYQTLAAHPAPAMSFFGATGAANSWFPPYPHAMRSEVTTAAGYEVVSLNGASRVSTFSPLDAAEVLPVRTVSEHSWEYLSTADIDVYRSRFWNCYARAGYPIQYYPDREVAAFVVVSLAAPSISECNPERMSGYDYHFFTLTLRRQV